MRRVLRLLSCALVLAGCQRTSSSAVATGGARYAEASAPARITVLREPDGAEIGIVEAKGNAPIDEIAEEFSERAAKLGANIAKVDSFRTKFELVTRTETYTYSCGTPQAPRTCSGTRVVTVEVATTSMVGRAFREEGR